VHSLLVNLHHELKQLFLIFESVYTPLKILIKMTPHDVLFEKVDILRAVSKAFENELAFLRRLLELSQ
jgi:hypothetical protein